MDQALHELAAQVAPLAAGDVRLGRFLGDLIAHLGTLHDRLAHLEGAAQSFAQSAEEAAPGGKSNAS